MVNLTLKRKASRLRDWNCRISRQARQSPDYLKRKASRLRDWNEIPIAFDAAVRNLKRKASRLRDWNFLPRVRDRADVHLKRKASRLRDWNVPSYTCFRKALSAAWKEKHLDYEIETQKRRYTLDSAYPWKEKHLDYEIETGKHAFVGWPLINLEKKSISITRLKLGSTGSKILGISPLKRKASRLRDWNMSPSALILPLPKSLKRKASRLRDWN